MIHCQRGIVRVFSFQEENSARRDYPEYPNYGYGEDRTFDDVASAGHHARGAAPGQHVGAAGGYGGAQTAAPPQYDYSAQGYGGYGDPNYYYPPAAGGYHGYGPPHPPPLPPANAAAYGAPPGQLS